MKALQQGVMKFTRDACALSDARLQCHLELMMQLPDAPSIGRPQQCQEDAAQSARNQFCIPPGGRDENG